MAFKVRAKRVMAAIERFERSHDDRVQRRRFEALNAFVRENKEAEHLADAIAERLCQIHCPSPGFIPDFGADPGVVRLRGRLALLKPALFGSRA